MNDFTMAMETEDDDDEDDDDYDGHAPDDCPDCNGKGGWDEWVPGPMGDMPMPVQCPCPCHTAEVNA